MAKKPDKKPEAEKAEMEVGTAAKPAGGLMGLLMLGGASLVSSFGLVYLLTPPPAAEVAACAPSEAGPAAIAPAANPDQSYVALKEMLITVGSAPATRYLKMNISIITDHEGAGAVASAEPMLLDAFNTYLRSVEMKDFEDPGFYPRMREQLTRRAELVLGSGVSSGVLITEFLLR
ncbi:flagellar basal body-associated FliL family protein [Hyphomonas sp.]|uniref:flagellar basal body-associated FliL family protein n=1 Tax=Hyphomonas sp. TaxID=87 RepID=UPI001D33CFEA|nr:flagellar basal body-associated FliL family protein [Hyphomonas sp.]MBU4062418.1 flagellar basal body-associated FliL family protein [Alphaproteobacteria bacterium]MBU4165973.1 flagellar basal body-associated FliL family protein [Alphaproteobacteria bacterium]